MHGAVLTGVDGAPDADGVDHLLGWAPSRQTPATRPREFWKLRDSTPQGQSPSRQIVSSKPIIRVID